MDAPHPLPRLRGVHNGCATAGAPVVDAPRRSGTIGPVGRGERDARELDGAWRHHQRHAFAAPEPALAPFVERFWTVDWSYATPYRQLVVPLPQVQLSWIAGQPPLVSGPVLGPVVRELSGEGRVVGVAFRPGGFRPFLDGPVSALAGRAVPAADVLPAPPPAVADASEAAAWLRTVLPPPDPVAEWVAGIVGLVAAEPALTRVDVLAERAGCGVRRLQRVFAEHVGVGPKRVVRRYRLGEVIARLAAGERIDWAGLAAELGYADQAHLVRDVTAFCGEPPTAYAARFPRGNGR